MFEGVCLTPISVLIAIIADPSPMPYHRTWVSRSEAGWLTFPYMRGRAFTHPPRLGVLRTFFCSTSHCGMRYSNRYLMPQLYKMCIPLSLHDEWFKVMDILNLPIMWDSIKNKMATNWTPWDIILKWEHSNNI